MSENRTSILLAAKYKPDGHKRVGGVQTWISTVRARFIEQGFEVLTWQPGDPVPERDFDLGIIAHAHDCRHVIPRCRRKVNVSHGVVTPEKPGLKMPIAYTSEEVKQKWGKPGQIVRQPIDLDFWLPGNVPAEGTLIHYGYRAGIACHREVAERLGLTPLRIKYGDAAEVKRRFQGASIVLASGRAALEAMATCVPVVICDNRSRYQPPLMDMDIEGSMTRNYSGRGGVMPDARHLLYACQEAMDRGSLRGHVTQHHDSRKIAQQLLSM